MRHSLITLKKGSIANDLRLAWFRAVMGAKSESKSTRLGYLWWLIDPAMHLLVYYLAFGVLLNQGGDDYVAYLMVGIVHWLWFSKSVMNSCGSIVGGYGLILQLPLNICIFPLAEILQDAMKQVMVGLVLILTLWAFGHSPGVLLIVYPVIFFIQLLLIVSVGCFVAALTPFFPDLRVIVPTFLQLGMFVSGVFFTRDIVPEYLQWALNFNPVYVLLESAREVLIRGSQPDWLLLGGVGAVVLLTATMALGLLSHFNQRYAILIQE
tara:strand:+ start:2805 stop:3602 length:798 start_codon:yes stop_codon:yes gene_type:complete